jgi:hypothetical protein
MLGAGMVIEVELSGDEGLELLDEVVLGYVVGNGEGCLVDGD